MRFIFQWKMQRRSVEVITDWFGFPYYYLHTHWRQLPWPNLVWPGSDARPQILISFSCSPNPDEINEGRVSIYFKESPFADWGVDNGPVGSRNTQEAIINSLVKAQCDYSVCGIWLTDWMARLLSICKEGKKTVFVVLGSGVCIVANKIARRRDTRPIFAQF